MTDLGWILFLTVFFLGETFKVLLPFRIWSHSILPVCVLEMCPPVSNLVFSSSTDLAAWRTAKNIFSYMRIFWVDRFHFKNMYPTVQPLLFDQIRLSLALAFWAVNFQVVERFNILSILMKKMGCLWSLTRIRNLRSFLNPDPSFIAVSHWKDPVLIIV